MPYRKCLLVTIFATNICVAAEIHDAVKAAKLDQVKALVQKNRGCLNSQEEEAQRSPVCWAVKYGRLDILKYLLSEKPDLETRDKWGRTALLEAAMASKSDEASLLVAAGADVAAQDERGNTPLHLAAYATKTESKKVALLLIQNKADVNAKDKSQRTPLYGVGQSGNVDVTVLLLANGAKANVADVGNVTPFHWAAGNGKLKVASLLLQSNADIKALGVASVKFKLYSIALTRMCLRSSR